MSTQSTIHRFHHPTGDVYVRSIDRPSANAVPQGGTASSISTRLGISKFGAFAAPFAVAAAVAAPAPPSVHRRILSLGEGTVSNICAIDWNAYDSLEYSEAYVTEDEIDALNRLYMLSPVEGFSLELPDA